ncbi:MAG TPA: hypothetical protein VMW38_25080 [Terriglobia bacterium]|nr:hypothetical protein [Terriglobia bacterium]
MSGDWKIDVVPIVMLALSTGLLLQGFWEYSHRRHELIGILMGLVGVFGIAATLGAVLSL